MKALLNSEEKKPLSNLSSAAEKPLLEVRGLTKTFHVKTGFFSRQEQVVRAVDDVTFNVYAGETLGLVGESGCGKTTAGRMIMRLIEPTAGEIIYNTESSRIDLGRLKGQSLRRFRSNVQMIFQDPYSSLNPRMRVNELIAEPLWALQPELSEPEVRDRVEWIAKATGLQTEHLSRYPHAFSGGQRQRICIARALVVRPRLVVCDEPVSALDVSVRAQIINLLKDLQQEFGLTYIFIAHDLAVVENISTRVAVMYAGRIVEITDTDSLYRKPLHPYTDALLQAVPTPDPFHRRDLAPLSGEIAEASNLPPGCSFHPRCPLCIDDCKTGVPPLREIVTNHQSACHRAELLLETNGKTRTR